MISEEAENEPYVMFTSQVSDTNNICHRSNMFSTNPTTYQSVFPLEFAGSYHRLGKENHAWQAGWFAHQAAGHHAGTKYCSQLKSNFQYLISPAS